MTTIEVERKYRLDHADIRPALAAAGYRPLDPVEQTDRYFDHPNRPFGVTDEALRLREIVGDEGTRVELTYKGPQRGQTAKSRPEMTVAVDDATTAHRLLRSLGFDAVASVAKTRERHINDDVTVALDLVDGLGSFVEVEVLTAEDAVSSAEARLEGAAAELGLDAATTIEQTYLGMLLEDTQE